MGGDDPSVLLISCQDCLTCSLETSKGSSSSAVYTLLLSSPLNQSRLLFTGFSTTEGFCLLSVAFFFFAGLGGAPHFLHPSLKYYVFFSYI